MFIKTKVRCNIFQSKRSQWSQMAYWLGEGGRDGGGSPIYKLYGHVMLQRVWFSNSLVWDRV